MYNIRIKIGDVAVSQQMLKGWLLRVKNQTNADNLNSLCKTTGVVAFVSLSPKSIWKTF